MEKIASFTIDHIKLQPGVYVSRKDYLGEQVITTFDLRMTSPNEEPVMNTAELHAIEHLAATYLRNDEEYKDKIIYWGPMGCRTGNYLLMAGDYQSKDIVPLMIRTFEFIRDFEGEIPGASAKDCGNYLDMNLGMAKYLAQKYLDVLYHITEDGRMFRQYTGCRYSGRGNESRRRHLQTGRHQLRRKRNFLPRSACKSTEGSTVKKSKSPKLSFWSVLFTPDESPGLLFYLSHLSQRLLISLANLSRSLFVPPSL